MRDIKTLKKECEESFLRELPPEDTRPGECAPPYDDPLRPGECVPPDDSPSHTALRKELEIYNLQVYEYLLHHSHPRIPRILSFREEEGKLVVYEQYIRGEDLERYAARSLSEEDKKRIVFQVLEGLEFLHGARPKIIHRDVKPGNIIIDGEGNAFLVDFDAAKVYREGETKDTVLMGTAGSAAPEQYGFGQSDERTDIYGAGMLIKQLGIGDGSWMRAAGKATRMDPDQRQQTVGELRTQLLSGRMEASSKGKWPKKAAAAAIWILVSLWIIFSNIRGEYASRGERILDRAFFFAALLMTGDLLIVITPVSGRIRKAIKRAVPARWLRIPVLAALSALTILIMALLCVIATMLLT